jgi:hypothetical protein
MQNRFRFWCSLDRLEIDKRTTELLAAFPELSPMIITSTRLWVDKEGCL